MVFILFDQSRKENTLAPPRRKMVNFGEVTALLADSKLNGRGRFRQIFEAVESFRFIYPKQAVRTAGRFWRIRVNFQELRWLVVGEDMDEFSKAKKTPRIPTQNRAGGEGPMQSKESGWLSFARAKIGKKRSLAAFLGGI